MRILALALLATLAVSAVASACTGTGQVEDPRADTDPPSLPAFYDLLGVNVTVNETTLVWSWDVASLENMRAVRYFGQFDLGNDTATATSGDNFHPRCQVPSAVFGDMECELTMSHALAANAITFERLGPLAFRIEGDRLSTDIPFAMLGVTEVEHIGHAAFSTQPVVSAGPPGYEPEASPVVSDRSEVFALGLCASGPATTAVEPSPTDGPAVETEAPGPGLVLALVALAAVLLARRA